jgi:MFS family permease
MKHSHPSRRLQLRLRLTVNRIAAGGRWPVQFPHETQHNLRNFFFDGVYASGSDAITITYLTLYLLALGASSGDIGWLNALSSLAAVVLLLPGAMLVDRFGNRQKTVVIAGGWFGRIPLLLMALIPFFLEGPSAIYVIIALKVVLDGARNLGLPAWVSLTADIVPLAWRGRYFGNRNLVMGISAMVITLIIGEVITRIGTPGGYQWAMGLAFAIGMLSTFYFSRIKEPTASEARTTPSRYSFSALRSTLRGDRHFLVFCLYTAFWTLSLNIAGPFFSVYLVQTLGATASIVGITTIITRISGIPAQRFFGVLADKWGPRKLTLVSGFLVPILPLMWLFIRSPWGVVPINILSGIFWAGYNLATFNLLLEVSPDEQRARYSAMYQIFVAGSAAAGAAIGGLIADQWGIRSLFLISGIGRFTSALFFLFGLYRKQYPAIPLDSNK